MHLHCWEKGNLDFYTCWVYLTHGSISYSTNEEVVNVRLLRVCPPDALRLYFQERNLIGRFLHTSDRKNPELNAAGRLTVKYQLMNNSGTFWDSDFQPIP